MRRPRPSRSGEQPISLYGGSTTDAVTGAKNYHEAFVGPTSSPSFNNWDEILFGLATQGTISYTVSNIGPRYGLKKGGYSANGFRGYIFPTWSCVTRFFTDKGLRWDNRHDTRRTLNPETLVPRLSIPTRRPRFSTAPLAPLLCQRRLR